MVLHSVAMSDVVRLVPVAVLTGEPPDALLASPRDALDVQELVFDALLAVVLLDTPLLSRVARRPIAAASMRLRLRRAGEVHDERAEPLVGHGGPIQPKRGRAAFASSDS